MGLPGGSRCKTAVIGAHVLCTELFSCGCEYLFCTVGRLGATFRVDTRPRQRLAGVAAATNLRSPNSSHVAPASPICGGCSQDRDGLPISRSSTKPQISATCLFPNAWLATWIQEQALSQYQHESSSIHPRNGAAALLEPHPPLQIHHPAL